MMSLGEKIKEARENLNISQSTLAQMLGVGTQTVWRWEKGQRTPHWKMIQNISQILNAPQLAEFTETIKSNENLAPVALGYWGCVVDNAKQVAKIGTQEEISLIKTLLKSAYDTLNLKKQQEQMSQNVDIHHNNMENTKFNFTQENFNGV